MKAEEKDEGEGKGDGTSKLRRRKDELRIKGIRALSRVLGS
jgi:ribosomal protein L19E